MEKERRRLAGITRWMMPVVFAIAFGLDGFVCGSLGPIYLHPTSNGPLFGFFTGPTAAVIGACVGVVVAVLRPTRKTTCLLFLGFMVAITVTILYFSLPPDQITGFIVDVEVVDCQSPNAAVLAKVDYWKGRVPRAPSWVYSRPGWEEDVENMVKEDPGIILTVKVKRRRDIYTKRKSWNNGEIYAEGWTQWSSNPEYLQRCYLRTATDSCGQYSVGSHHVFLLDYDHSNSWPPDTVPGFLMIPFVSDVPQEYRRFVNN